MTLQILIKESGLKQARLAEACAVSEATISQIVRHGRLPRRDPGRVLAALAVALEEAGVSGADVATAINTLTATQNSQEPPQDNQEEKIAMILKRQTFTQQARQAFGLKRDPFDDPQTPEQVYLSPRSRYVREAMRDAAVNGNFLAVVGQSGSGKSTLKSELCEHLADNEKSVIVIEPYVLTMALTDNGAGKPMKTHHIIESIISKVEPSARTNGSQEMMSQRVHDVLIRSARTGKKHVLIIEEAHDLHTQTLKALKRFWELKDGMKRLLSIILIGQNELGERLQRASADVREVVQRCDVVTLPPLPDIGEFIRHRFASVGYDADAIFSEDAMGALRQHLIVAVDKTGKSVDMAYPLAVGNLATACVNFAAANGMRRVDADVVDTSQK